MARFFRIIVVIVKAFFRPRLTPTDESVLRLRVWPHEADWSNVHQAIYPLFMELGRWDLAIRSGLARWLIDQRCAGILGAQMISYHRPLKRLAAFEVRTRVLGWDDKWFYVEHRLQTRGQTMSRGCVRLMFLDSKKKRVAPVHAIRACGSEADSPSLGELPELLAKFAHDGRGAESLGAANQESRGSTT